MLIDGIAEAPNDKSIITLLETVRANNITINCDTVVFKSKDLKFFGGNITPQGYKVDPKKVKAITEMKPLENFQDHQSYL